MSKIRVIRVTYSVLLYEILIRLPFLNQAAIECILLLFVIPMRGDGFTARD